MHILRTISGPLIGALIGYFTNFIAVKMLFFPKHEVRVFGKRREQGGKRQHEGKNERKELFHTGTFFLHISVL